MALRSASSFRMQATMMTLLRLTVCLRRAAKVRMTGLQRMAVTVAMYRTERTAARPPRMVRLPVRRPESSLKGATPTGAPICAAQFVQVGQQGGAEHGADAGYGLQQLVDRVEVVVGVDQLSDLDVQFGDLLFEGFKHGIDGPQGGFADGPPAAVGLLGADVRQLPAAGDQGFEFDLVFRAFFGQAGRRPAGELDQHLGINGVGLGQNSQAFGEVANVGGIDPRHWQVGVQQRIQQWLFETTGGFEDDDGGRRGA